MIALVFVALLQGLLAALSALVTLDILWRIFQPLRCRKRLYLGRLRGPLGTWLRPPSATSMLVIGPPDSGKTTGLVVANARHWAGSLVVTSTKRDVLDASVGHRLHRGRVFVLDPMDIAGQSGGLPEGAHKLSWSPIRGCGDWSVAQARASALVHAASFQGVKEGSYWRDASIALLAPMLHAAALGHQQRPTCPTANCTACVRCKPMTTIMQWVENRSTKPVEDLLRRVEGPHVEQAIGKLAAFKDATRGSGYETWSTVSASPLSPFGNVRVLAEADQISDWAASAFLSAGDSIFVIARSDAHVNMAPVVVGLVEEIREAAIAMSGAGPLERELLFLLDEATNICPLHNLPSIVSEGRSHGVRLMVVVQDVAQLEERWGRTVSQLVRSACGILALPGVKNVDTLKELSHLCDRSEWHRDEKTGQRKRVALATMTGSDIRCLPNRRGLLILNSSRHLVVRLPSFDPLWRVRRMTQPFLRRGVIRGSLLQRRYANDETGPRQRANMD